MTQFWMIYGEDCAAPTYRHLDETSARAEAERLAHSTPGKRFFILKAEAFCIVHDPIQWAQLTDEIPF